MATRKTSATDPTPEEPADEQPPPATAETVTVDRSELVDVVKEVVADMLPKAPPADDTPPPASNGRRPSLRDEEDAMESQVTKALEKVLDAREERAAAAKPEEKIVEKPPGQPKRLTRFFGWDREPEKAK